jgi:hypothetical protein
MRAEAEDHRSFEVIEGSGQPVARRALSTVTAAELLMGPGRVVETGPSWALVECAGRAEPERAELAFSVPYAPAVGDLLVVLGKPGELYAVGVLRGSGKTTLAVEGDLDVAASGTLRLRGAAGVAIEGGDVSIEANRLETTAKTVVEVVGSLVQRVTGLFSQQARDVYVHAEGSVVTRGKNATILTEESVVVNGKQLFLG